MIPKNFLWGASIASHQVEGDNHNDWSEWEKQNADRLAQESKNKFGHLPNWPEIKNAAQDPKNYISSIATDHYNRFEEDFNIAQSLGLNALRISIEWSRIEPQENVFDQKEIDHYKKVVAALQKRNIEPFVTLWHFTNPLWFSKIGGWKSPKASFYFTRYVEKIVTALPEVKFWVTINEPEIYANDSFYKGVWPPQEKSFLSYLKVLKNLIRAHKKAYIAIKKISPTNNVGVAKNNAHFEPRSRSLIHKTLTASGKWWWNERILRQINNFQDFIGLNYYFHHIIRNPHHHDSHHQISDLGWGLHPEGIYHVLSELKEFKKPIYILENGLADAKDEKRAWFIKETIKNLGLAIDNGCDVRGYFHWSLTDNFEWDKGFWPRFGLAEIDYKTLQRKIRLSAFEYSKIIKQNGL